MLYGIDHAAQVAAATAAFPTPDAPATVEGESLDDLRVRIFGKPLTAEEERAATEKRLRDGAEANAKWERERDAKLKADGEAIRKFNAENGSRYGR
jgi:hypothetical protein